MADCSSCYEAYGIYWRGMQVDIEIVLNNEGPVMVKESDNFNLLRGQYNI